ncbi:endonuclease/exonuclease/phosphatase family protein [Nocardia sp. NBC_00508]|uniref:endonuclease/exonuclease/phosphatase family protein n=1 Tax=Nocardia sp. NBC_00508 TaxID=2975992 RepID=UPI002E80DEBA|nr:endonuclease/exonuclease/phosphatase family protein [Nocardia sp. NBC_00508]WUD65719.1 endonuclease/exonuclease/phosphatase family protein [Nocardia sp. NBC_00508]
MITVASWNVLHRVHAENWYEDVATRWPDEGARIAAVTARVAERTERIIALQEVSGDQLASLRMAMPNRTFHAMRYQRLPTPRRVPSSLLDGGEYLVVLTAAPSRELAAESFALDQGKGALVVDAGGLVVISTHVTGDRRRVAQLSRLAELATAAPEYGAVLLGDFNTDRATVAAGLGNGFAVAECVAGALPTRPRASGAKSQFIDHVVVHGATVTAASVDDVGGVSDHNLIRAAVTI